MTGGRSCSNRTVDLLVFHKVIQLLTTDLLNKKNPEINAFSETNVRLALFDTIIILLQTT